MRDKGQNLPRANGFPVGRLGAYKAWVNSEYGRDSVDLYIGLYDHMGISKPKHLEFDKKDDKIVWVEHEEGGKLKPLFSIGEISDATPIFVAIAEALHDAGYYPRIENSERIISEALSKERLEQIEYLRKQMEKTHGKILENIATAISGKIINDTDVNHGTT